MADSTILPGARADLIQGTIPSPEFYRFFQAVAKAAGLTGDLQTQVTQITKVIEDMQGNQGRLMAGEGIDVTGVLSNGIAVVSLADSGVTPGTYGDTTHVPVITFDEYGRATAADVVALSPSFVPYLVPDGAVFVVPLNAQALWTIPIELEGDTGLEIDGALVEVN